METFTKLQFWAELEQIGEDIVRERIIAKVYGSANQKKELAEEWIRVQEAKRSDAKEALVQAQTKEGNEISRSSKNAAWAAAICAAIAIPISIAALYLSFTK